MEATAAAQPHGEASARTRGSEAPFRPQPNTVEETGLGFGQLVDLCIKTIYYAGRPSARQVSEAMALSFNIIEVLLAFLKREQLIQTVGSSGVGEQQYQYSLSDKGNERAVEALERNQYLGPTPVPYAEYVEVIKEQTVRNMRVDPAIVDDALGDLVLTPITRNLVGPAVNSGRTLLLYGDPGNGKSSIAKGIGRMLKGEVLVPYAVDVNGQIVRLYDPRVHSEVAEAYDANSDRRGGFVPVRPERRRDSRYVVC